MKHTPTAKRAAVALCCLFVAALAVLSGRAQELAEQDPPAPEATFSALSGRAVYQDTGRPVRRARVFLFSPYGRGPELTSLTDGRGDFRFPRVSAGRYFAAVDVAGALSPVSLMTVEELNASYLNEQELSKYFDTVEVDGKADKEMTIRVRRGAAIGGRVTYPDTEPAVNVLVHIMRRTEGGLTKVLTGMSRGSLSGLRTDDRGVYRVSGLPPGEYIVAVSEAADHNGSGAPRDDFGDFSFMQSLFGPQLLMTFHPSATSVKDATVIKVEMGENHDEADITVAERASYTVAGVVRARRGGRPLASAKVSIRQEGTDEATPAEISSSGEDGRFSTTTDPEGRWRFNELPEGNYLVIVKPPDEYTQGNTNLNMNSIVERELPYGDKGTRAPAAPARRKLAPTRRQVRVSDDVDDLVVELDSGARISGFVSIEGGIDPAQQQLSIRAIPAASGFEQLAEAYGSILHAGVADGTFNIEGMSPGRYHLRSEGMVEHRGLYLKAITWNGRDLLREPLEVEEGASIEGVRFVYARGHATVSVRVNGTADRTAQNINVFLVPTGAPPAWNLDVAQNFCSTGPSDECSTMLAPGEYLVVALRGAASPRAFEAELRRRAATAPRLTVGPNEKKRVEVAAP